MITLDVTLVMYRCYRILRRLLSYSWLVPLLVAGNGAALWLFLVVMDFYLRANGTQMNPPVVLKYTALIWGALTILSVPAAGCWLVAQTVLCMLRRAWGRLVLSWVFTAASGVGCLVLCLLMAFFCFLGGGADPYARGLEIPREREFVLPRELVIFENLGAPLRVLQLRDMKSALPSAPNLQELPQVPALQQLSAQAPELLQEYLLRCLYAESTNPRFNSPLLGGSSRVFLAHEHDPQSYLLRTLRGKKVMEVVREDRQLIRQSELPPYRWQVPLQNGWSVVYNPHYQWSKEEVRPNVVAGQLQRLNDALLPLAQNPTREQLDSLLPPLPQRPFLCLWDEDSGGCYQALVVLPAEYKDGTVELRAHEYTTGKPVAFHSKTLPVVPLGNVCSVAADEDLLVISGDWGEYYVAVWEIWYSPADGAEPRCLASQEFVIMGWQH